MKIGVVTSRFNPEITDRLKLGACDYLRDQDIQFICHDVPGAVEIPLVCQALFQTGYDGVVALGCVIKGETYHFESVCQSVERGVTEVMLKYSKPIGFGVLMTYTDEQAEERVGGKHGHKGREAAEVTVEMARLLTTIEC